MWVGIAAVVISLALFTEVAAFILHQQALGASSSQPEWIE